MLGYIIQSNQKNRCKNKTVGIYHTNWNEKSDFPDINIFMEDNYTLEV